MYGAACIMYLVAQRILQLLRDTEIGVRAFQRSQKWREAAKVISLSLEAS